MTDDIERWIANLHELVPEAEFVSLEPEDGEHALLAAVWQIGTKYKILGYGNQAYDKPEFLLEIEAASIDDAAEWALAMLQFADDHRHVSDLVSGALFASSQRLVPFSELEGWVIGLACDVTSFGLEAPYLILYPIYSAEVEIFKQVGLTTFLRKIGDAIYQPSRMAIKKEPQ